MTKPKSYQQMQNQLNQLVDSLRAKNEDIDTSMKKYQEASELIKEMEAYLKDAENKLINIKKDFSSDN